jgi:hypothetical protein
MTEPAEPAESPELLPPTMSGTWKVAMVGVPVSAVMAFIALFQTLYSYEYQGVNSSGPFTGNPVIVTLWRTISPDGNEQQGPPDYRFPLLLGSVALLASAVILILSVDRPSVRAIGRTITFVSTAFFAGVVWMVYVDVDYAGKRFADFEADSQIKVVFATGDAVWFSVIAAVLAIVSSVLLLTPALAPPRLAGPSIYRIAPDETA